MILELAQTAAADLGIIKESFESVPQWIRRVTHSVIGLQMLTALLDNHDEELEYDGTVSIQRVIRRGEKLAEVFDAPEIDISKICDSYIKAGYVLHKNNRLACPKTTIGDAGSAFVARGLPPWKAQAASGLGLLLKKGTKGQGAPAARGGTSKAASGGKAASATQPNLQDIAIDIAEMFSLEDIYLQRWADRFFATISWKTVDSAPKNVDYLNIYDSATEGYFLPHRPADGLTVVRSKNAVNRSYGLFRFSESKIEMAELPQWRFRNAEYCRIALALRSRANNPPCARITKHNSVALVDIDYFLPPQEQNFFELFSWSQASDYFSPKGRLKRVVSIELVDVYKTMLQRLGFGIEEALK
ncbi:MAG: hypothetical protein LBC41_07470 [Clostridiales bacterium]|jgi:hypothetical protein|nr:hypothetical protein [Clostridiales bacterium]